MVQFLSTKCENCGRYGPYMASCDEGGANWKLGCLYCGHNMQTTKLRALEQIRLQQEVGGHGCPKCGEKVPAMSMLDGDETNPLKAIPQIKYFECTNCGYREPMRPENFEYYKNKLGNRLNIPERKNDG